MGKGHFEAVAEKFDLDRFQKLPIDKNVGLETAFEELRSCFENNQVGIIGLYGMGGVGKTTFLKKFNNDFLSTKTNDAVIWAVASKDADPRKIQDDIRKKLRVQDDIWNNEMVNDVALLLYNILYDKKFVLLLDDVWERIDLLQLGVPSPNNHECKIIFTTRSKEVCGLMGAQRHIRINCLTPNKAFELFKEKVGETTLEDPHILSLAKQVVDKCQGLPLALCTVGRAMANKVTPNEWRRSIKILKSYPSKVRGIVADVYCLLEFSYDRLPDAYKSCFLYCALFPELYNIPKEELIFLWMAEGFLVECDHNIYEARKLGEEIISDLKYACLLENGEEEDTIKMHDVVRDMALWVACDHGKNTRFFVSALSVTSGHEIYNQAKWKEVEMLSMQGRGETFTNFWPKLQCDHLVTLLIRETSIQVFPTEVFVLPTTIKVLDLSFNFGISNLPPAISDFVNLEHMNVSFTGITMLPEGLKNLKKLRFLLLDGIEKLDIPKEVISSLRSLQAFSLRWWLGYRRIDEDALLNELEVLDHLQVIRISVCSISSVKKILISKLQRCMCDLRVTVSHPLHNLLSSLGKMEHLEALHIAGEDSEDANIPMWSSLWDRIQLIIILRELTITSCDYIHDLSFLIHAPNLELLELKRCDSLVEVISEDFEAERVESSNLFCSLTYLHLESLSNLRSICRMALQCRCLKEIRVTKCPNLKRLPFNSQSALTNLRYFAGDSTGWLDQLEWEDEATKHLLSSKFARAQTYGYGKGSNVRLW